MEWISVKDKLPDKAGYYLICEVNNIILSLGAKFFSLRGKYFSSDYLITHWMPLPKPPCEK